MNRRHLTPLLLALLAAPLGAQAQAQAQAYPARPVTLVVPVSPGGAMDAIGRMVAEGMGHALGQPVIVDNAPGASGIIGVGRVARARPDGYTLLYSSLATQVINAANVKLPYDVVKDFRPVAFISSTPWVVAVRKSLPVDNLPALVRWLKEHPGKGTMGTGGNGTPSHLGGLLLQNLTQTQFELVPYKGNAPVAQDLLGAQIDFAILDPVTALPFMRAGSLKVIAVLSGKRIAAAPEVATVDEAGLPGFHLAPWQAIWAPHNTPTAAIKRLNAAVVRALDDPALRSRLLAQGYDLGPASERTPEHLAAFHQAEIDKWWPIVRAAHGEGK